MKTSPDQRLAPVTSFTDWFNSLISGVLFYNILYVTNVHCILLIFLLNFVYALLTCTSVINDYCFVLINTLYVRELVIFYLNQRLVSKCNIIYEINSSNYKIIMQNELLHYHFLFQWCFIFYLYHVHFFGTEHFVPYFFFIVLTTAFIVSFYLGYALPRVNVALPVKL